MQSGERPSTNFITPVFLPNRDATIHRATVRGMNSSILSDKRGSQKIDKLSGFERAGAFFLMLSLLSEHWPTPGGLRPGTQ